MAEQNMCRMTQLRLRYGISQADLANAAGVSRQLISLIELDTASQSKGHEALIRRPFPLSSLPGGRRLTAGARVRCCPVAIFDVQGGRRAWILKPITSQSTIPMRESCSGSSRSETQSSRLSWAAGPGSLHRAAAFYDHMEDHCDAVPAGADRGICAGLA